MRVPLRPINGRWTLEGGQASRSVQWPVNVVPMTPLSPMSGLRLDGEAWVECDGEHLVLCHRGVGRLADALASFDVLVFSALNWMWVPSGFTKMKV